MRKVYLLLFLAVVLIMSTSSASYAYREIAKGSFTGMNTESITVLESKEILVAALTALRAPKLEIADSFDFTKEFLVLIVASACPNPGYTIVAEAIEFKNGEVNVKYKTERGPDGMMYAQVISYPWLLVAIER